MTVFKHKNNLIGTDRIWVGGDLTPHRSKMAYLAQVVGKESRAVQTRTFGGRVFLKTKKEGRPQIIKTALDIPKEKIHK